MADGVTPRALDPAGDRQALERLWEVALAPTWPLLLVHPAAQRRGLAAACSGPRSNGSAP